jgi:hypothetical protein
MADNQTSKHPSKAAERLASELRAEIQLAKQDGDMATLRYLIDEGEHLAWLARQAAEAGI